VYVHLVGISSDEEGAQGGCVSRIDISIKDLLFIWFLIGVHDTFDSLPLRRAKRALPCQVRHQHQDQCGQPLPSGRTKKTPRDPRIRQWTFDGPPAHGQEPIPGLNQLPPRVQHASQALHVLIEGGRHLSGVYHLGMKLVRHDQRWNQYFLTEVGRVGGANSGLNFGQCNGSRAHRLQRDRCECVQDLFGVCNLCDVYLCDMMSKRKKCQELR
jgi:hypothetical protein